MDFSDALKACRKGNHITRASWNDPGQYVFQQEGYPGGIELNQNTAKATGIPKGTIRKFAPYLMLCNAQGVFVPWTPTQDDLLDDDWKTVNLENCQLIVANVASGRQ